MKFYFRHFSVLSVQELHDIFELRAQVFVVEQNCVYADPDGKDPDALHILNYENGQLRAYCRILPAGISYKELSIGRVIVATAARRRGAGKQLMQFAISTARSEFGAKEIVISAQTYLQKFYKDLGFIPEGDEYLEDGIPHIKMRYRLIAASSPG